MKLRFGTPDVSWLCNGMLAGMVAITAPCAFVTAPVAILIGVVAGVLVINSALFIENVLKIDDPVGASSVHGACGAWGILALGLFADGRYGDGWNGVPGKVRGLFYGDGKQFVAECIGILVVRRLGRARMTFLTLRVIGAFVRNRVSAVAELDGLDVPEMGIEGYTTEADARVTSAKEKRRERASQRRPASIDDEDMTAPGVQPGRRRARLSRQAGGRRAVGPRADGVPRRLARSSCS